MLEQEKPVLEGWETEEQIGKGGFGAVYRIRREEAFGVQETAALKELSIPQDENEIRVLRASGMDDESISTQFHEQVQDIVREYRLMMGLKNCPNIVHCDDFRVEAKGLGYQILLRMELLSPLTRELSKGTLNSEQAVLTLGSHMCNALTVCHEQGILHRDVKPQNIFLAPDGSFKLGDFGIARTMEKNVQATSGIGTYNYMAPEVFNNQPYDSRADVYSLGMVLYNLLNGGRGPFLPPAPAPLNADHYADARYRRFSGEPLPPPARGSGELKAIVLKACAFDPRRRYLTAAQMKQDLDALARGQTGSLLALNQEVQDFEDEEKTVLAAPSAKPRRGKWLIPVLLAAAVAVGGLFFRKGEEAPPAPTVAATLPVQTTQPAPVLAPPTVSQQPGEYDHRLKVELTHEDPEAQLYFSLEYHQEQENGYTGLHDLAKRQRYLGPLTMLRGRNIITAYAQKGDLRSDSVKFTFTVDYPSQEAVFQERAMEAAVRDRLKKPSGALSTYECEEVGSLHFSSETEKWPMKTLEDLQYLPFVTHIPLSDQGRLEDYSPLGNCPYLQTLLVWDSKVPDLNFLEQVPYLKSLHLYDCTVEDITGLSYGENLEELTLEGEDYNLEAFLTASPNLVSLRTLSITHAGDALEAVGKLTGLQDLSANGLEGADLSPLGNLTELEALSLSPQSDVLWITGSSQKKTYDVPQDFSFLKNLKKLTTLSLNSMVTDPAQLSCLHGLDKLTNLSLYNCPATSDEEAMAALREALPNCSIRYEDSISSLFEEDVQGNTHLSLVDTEALLNSADVEEFFEVYRP